MAGVLQHLRSSTLNKRPNPASMVDGQVAINYASGAPGMFFKDSNGSLVKVGPVHVGSGAPNAVPASGGTAGNSMGEQWLDTSGGTYVFKIWDGSAWRSEAGEFVNVTGDTMTGALGIIAGSAASPSLFISGDANTGLYSPGADQVAISTNGTQRLLIEADGDINIDGGGVFYDATNNRLGIGTSTPNSVLQVNSGTNLGGLLIGFSSGSSNFYDADLQVFRTGNGTERARIDSSGRLLVGTSTSLESNAKIQVQNGHVHLYENSSTASAGYELQWSANGGATGRLTAAIRGVLQTTGTSGGYLTFSTTADGASSPTERMRIKANGVTCIGTSTEGTMSGDTVVAIGPNIGIISKSASGIATSGTVDISITTGGGGYQGFLVVSNTDASNAAVRTHTTFSVFGRGTDSSIQQIATDNGTTSGASFTVTTPTDGVIRVTNTSAGSSTVNIQFFGGTSA